MKEEDASIASTITDWKEEPARSKDAWNIMQINASNAKAHMWTCMEDASSKIVWIGQMINAFHARRGTKLREVFVKRKINWSAQTDIDNCYSEL